MHDFDQNFVINLTPGTLNNKFKNPYYLRRFGSLATVSVFGEHPSGELRIIKSVAKSNVDSEAIQKVFKELSIERRFKHPAICQIREIFEDSTNYYFIREYIEGGDIITKMLTSPVSISQVFKSLLTAVAYYHSKQIAVGDIKPQNLIFHRLTSSIKFSDFRCKRFMTDKEISFMSPDAIFLAPELIDRGNEPTTASDMWSCGVILYLLCSGKVPFESETSAELRDLIKKGKWSFEDEVWKSVPEAPKKIISKLLVFNPLERASVEVMLKDDWVQGNLKHQPDFFLSPAALENLREYRTKHEFFCDMTSLLSTEFMAPICFDKLIQKYRELDTENKGRLPKKVLVKGFKDLFGQMVSEERIRQTIDFNNTISCDANINYIAMLKSAENRQNQFLMSRVDQIFRILDKNDVKAVDTSLFLESLKFDGRDWASLLQELNLTQKRTISQDDFLKLMIHVIFAQPTSMILQ